MFVDWVEIYETEASGCPINLDEASFTPEILDPGIPETENGGVSKAPVELVRAAASVHCTVAASGINHLITLKKPQNKGVDIPDAIPHLRKCNLQCVFSRETDGKSHERS